MGILRSDRVTHSSLLEGGAVQFAYASSQYLNVTTSGSTAFGTGDFTVELWVNSSRGTGTYQNMIATRGASGVTTGWTLSIESDGTIGFYSNGHQFTAAGLVVANTWTHVAVSRESGYIRAFQDGVLISGASSSQDYTGSSLTIGIHNDASGTGWFDGYMSNVRLTRKALYSTSFTPPLKSTSMLWKAFTEPSTSILCCQSSSSATEEATGRSITASGASSTAPTPVAVPYRTQTYAPIFKQDIIDIGPVFADNTKFDTLSYMVPPGGTTAQRGRGRGLFPGGNNPSYLNNIDYIQIQSLGNAIDFGDAIVTYKQRGSFSSQTRAVSGGGYDGSSTFNVIDYVTMATTGNSSDFGDLTVARRNCVPAANSTRGVWLAGGTPTIVNTIDYITIASAGNATDFGDALDTVGSIGGGSSSPTRAIFAGGAAPAGNTITYLTIATTGNSADFGDILTGVTNKPAGTSSATRGLIICGESQPTGTRLNTIQYVTIASLGNATDFGDNSILQRSMGACSNSLRAVYGGGNGPSTPTALNTLSYVEIATTGNGQDFGDLTTTKSNDSKNCSDSHGGIS